MSFRYFIIHKPYGMLSQFTREHGHKALGDLFNFPKDVYPVGRLDSDSEGLLLITNDKKINHLLLDPAHRHRRTYLAQLEGTLTEEAILKLKEGVTIRVNNKDHFTLPAKVEKKDKVNISERVPPVRFRKNVPTSWISLTLTEGKNRQVRKMTAAVGFPTLRLVRIAIEDILLEEMKTGEVRELKREAVYKKLKLNK